jgi:hypothetical protein
MHLMMDIITHRLCSKVISRNACDDGCHYPMRVMEWYHRAVPVLNGIIM